MNLQIAIFKTLNKQPQSPVEILKSLKKFNEHPTRPDLHKTLKQLIIEGYLTKTIPLKNNLVKYSLTVKGKTIISLLKND